jgi:hypothetical protein
VEDGRYLDRIVPVTVDDAICADDDFAHLGIAYLRDDTPHPWRRREQIDGCHDSLNHTTFA